MTSTIFVSPSGNDTNSGASAAFPKTLSGGMGSAAAGDIISMADGVYARLDVSGKVLHFVATTAPTPDAVAGFSGGHPARQTRGVIVNEATIANAADCTFTNLWFKWEKWIDTTAGQTWTSVGAAPPTSIVRANTGGHAPVFTGCEFSWGYGPTNDPFDTNTVYPEFQSGAYAVTNVSGGIVPGRGDAYQSWWVRDDVITGSATPTNSNIPNGRAYNTVFEGPRAFSMANASLRAPQFYGCHFHDLTAGIHAYADRGPFVVDQCWFERIYADCMTGGQSIFGLASGYGLQVTRSIVEQPFAISSDSGNPHVDFLQNFSNWLIPNTTSPMRYGNVRIERNFGLVRPTDRGSFQFLFLQGPAGHDHSTKGVTYWNPIVRDNATLQRNSDKGLLLESAYDGLIEYNCFLRDPAVTSASATRLNLTENPYTKSSGVPLVRNNIIETGSLIATAVGVDNVAVGKDYTKISDTALLQGPFPLTGGSDVAAGWYDSMARQTTYAAKGPRYATLEDLVTQSLTAADMPLFVGWADQQQCALNAVVTTDGSTIRGPLGTTVDISVDKGQFQIEDIDGNVLNAWQGGPLSSVAVGSVLRLRQTTSASGATPVVQTASLVHGALGTETFTFTASTLSNVVLPTVSIPTTAWLANPASTNMGAGSSSHRFTFAMRFTPTISSSGGFLYGHTSGTNQPLGVRVLGSNKIRISSRNASGTVLISSSWDSATALQLNHEYLLIVSMDLAAGAGACTARAWDLTDGTSHLTWATPTITDDLITFATNHKATINFDNGSNVCAPNVNFVYLDSTLSVDANSSAAFLLFANAYLGPNGEGPTGSAPLVFVAGPASDWTVGGGINRGTGCKFVAAGSGIADVESPVRPYPPVLDLKADPQATGPYPVNDPLDFLVAPVGYGVACTVTPSSDKSGTWSASPLSVPAGQAGATLTFTPTQTGTHTITFTNSAGYNNPASQTLDVI